MKVVGLNGREYNINLKKYIVKHDDKTVKSKYHIAARNLLSDMFSGYTVLEEVKLPGSRCPSKKSALFLDFFIPNLQLGIEVHGQQHYEFCKFFHKTKAGFLTSLKRDFIKEDWCNLNQIELIVLKYSDSVKDWREQIDSR
tara:strand:+ start:1472 stop:1894 length:423 start_codon:yes stop_codon:yes gene_type:complete